MNFMNSPGAMILREIGVPGPWQNQSQQAAPPPQSGQAAPSPQMVQPPMGAPMQMPTMASAPPLPELGYKRPEGLFNKLARAFAGGAGG